MQLDRWFFIQLMLIGVLSTVSGFVHNVSIHVLETHVGKPAPGVQVTFFNVNDDYNHHEHFIDFGTTDFNGKVTEFRSTEKSFTPGIYKLRVNTKGYFAKTNRTTFYPFIDIAFEVEDPNLHYHIPLVLNAYSYTTYRGSLKHNLKGKSKSSN